MPFIATINTPGYLPMDDDPPMFETPAEAWEWLEGERRHEEDEAVPSACIAAGCTDPTCPWDADAGYTDTVRYLHGMTLPTHEGHAECCKGAGVIYGSTPGYHGDHDLGLAYSVTYLPGNDDTLTLTTKED